MTRMLRVIAIVAALVALAVGTTFAQKGYDLFQQGLAKERAEGKPQDAIALYQQAIKEAGSDRALVAKALVQMAGCYDKLKSPEARKTYQRVVDEFSDQTEMVAEAKAHLAPVAAPKADASQASSLYVEPVARPVPLPAGALSPDGQFVAFPENGSRDLVVRMIATGETRRPVTRTAPELLWPLFAWSRDSKRLAYSVCMPPPAGSQARQCDLRVIGIDGSGESVVLPRSNGLMQIFDWSSDGRNVAVRIDGRPTANTSLFGLASITDHSLRELRTFNAGELGWCPDTPSLSPDGRYLAYGLGGKDKSCDIFVLATDGSGERPLIQHPADDQFLAWTPDGSVLFTSDRSGTTDIWLAHVENGHVDGLPQRLKRDIAHKGDKNGAVKVPARISAVGLMADGAFYYQMPASGNGEVYVASIDPSGHVLSSPAPIAQSNIGHNSEPRWSPNGRFLTYTTMPADANTYNTITVASFDTGAETHIRPQPALDFVYGSHGWSPDGRYLLVNGQVAGKGDVYKVDAQTGAATPLGITQLGGIEFLPDGQTVVYLTGTVLATLTLETRAERKVYSADPNTTFNNLGLSRDGTRVALVLTDSTKKTSALIVVNIASGQARQVVQLHNALEGAKKVAWSPDGQYLFYVERPQAQVNREEAWRVAVDGGPPEKIGLSVDGRLEFLRVHPDGRHLAFAVASTVPGGTFVLDRLVPANDRPVPAVRRIP